MIAQGICLFWGAVYPLSYRRWIQVLDARRRLQLEVLREGERHGANNLLVCRMTVTVGVQY
jgi:hypothetical protein